jgi:serine/threonine protein kinase
MAHRRSIVHRDVKPHNFFLTRSGEIKLGDFGLARLRADDPSAELDAGGQSALGTPHYVAPEQILNFAQADERSDQYSLGVMLFEALAGRVPFAGRTLIDILKAQLHEPPPLNFLPKDTPRSLRSCVERCLQKDPMKRFQTDDELISALELVLRDLDPSVRATTRFLRGLRKLVGGDPDSP